MAHADVTAAWRDESKYLGKSFLVRLGPLVAMQGCERVTHNTEGQSKRMNIDSCLADLSAEITDQVKVPSSMVAKELERDVDADPSRIFLIPGLQASRYYIAGTEICSHMSSNRMLNMTLNPQSRM